MHDFVTEQVAIWNETCARQDDLFPQMVQVRPSGSAKSSRKHWTSLT